MFTKPNVGNIKIYTSGWPKNQKRCWNNMVSPPYTNSKNVVCQCLSINNINIDAPKTGVTTASILIVNNKLIVIKGSKDRLFLKPGIAKVRLVIKRLVNDIVVLIPANITEVIKIS